MRTRKLIMYFLDYDTGEHIDSVVYTGELVNNAIQAAQALAKKAYVDLKNKQKTATKISGYLVQEFPAVFQAVKKDTAYLAFCAILVPTKSAATA